jgi:glutathione S-transferase
MTNSADTVVNLDELRVQIQTIADKITSLKKDPSSNKDEIASSVKALLDAKRLFAQNNNGIGVDGNPFVEPMSKAEKKAKEKAEKQKNAGASEDGNNASDPNSANSLKKAAKKAEAKAKKAAMKAGAGNPTNTPPVESNIIPQAQDKDQKVDAQKDKKSKNNNAKKKEPMQMINKPQQKSKLAPMQLSYNPNAPLTERPVVALTIACLTNTMNDVDIVSDHTRTTGPALGLPLAGCEVVGDAAIARYLARRSAAASSPASLLLSEMNNDEYMAMVDSWVDYALSLSKFQSPRRIKSINATLNHYLADKTYLVGDSLSLADLIIFAGLGFPSQSADADYVKSIVTSNGPMIRWMEMLRVHPAIREATQLAVGISSENSEASFGEYEQMDSLAKGMNLLQGGTVGNVVTRFPPEPSGYLHIGHAKAVLMNEYYANRYKGRLILRFDDTNPSKEKEEFQSSIVEDLAMLGVKPSVVTFTSDYFRTIKGYALQLIEDGKAYMDDTPQEQMQKERMERVNSKHRDQSVEDALKYFDLMCSGKEEGKKMVFTCQD